MGCPRAGYAMAMQATMSRLVRRQGIANLIIMQWSDAYRNARLIATRRSSAGRQAIVWLRLMKDGSPVHAAPQNTRAFGQTVPKARPVQVRSVVFA